MHDTLSGALFEAQTKGISGRLLESRGWKLWKLEYPTLEISFFAEGRTELRLLFRCDGWNELPPSVELYGADGLRLTSLQGRGLPNQFHNGPHNVTKLPFICMAGTREYHRHESHVRDLWENYKNKSKYTLDGILFQVWDAWTKGTG